MARHGFGRDEVIVIDLDASNGPDPQMLVLAKGNKISYGYLWSLCMVPSRKIAGQKMLLMAVFAVLITVNMPGEISRAKFDLACG